MMLKDQVALVTGAGQGIGAASAKALAEAGAIVVAVDIDGALVEKMARSLAAHQHRTLGIAADVGSVADIQRMVDRAITDYGRIDILVNNAGVTRRADIMDITEADWDRIHRVNAKGVFFCLQTVARTMIPRRSGRIINIASIAGMHASVQGPHYAPYAATKAGLIGLTRELAVSWARKGIRVNAIAPGFFHSRLADGAIAMNEASIKASSPIPRVGEAGELKGVAVFLAADASNYITGQTIVVDGGATLPETGFAVERQWGL